MGSLIWRVPIGSRPVVGSSRMRNSGSLMRAWAMSMPLHSLGVLADRAVLDGAEADHIRAAVDAADPDAAVELEELGVARGFRVR